MIPKDYEKISSYDVDGSSSGQSDESLLSAHTRPVRSVTWRTCSLICLATALVSMLSGVGFTELKYRDLQKLCFEKTSTWSPAIAEIDTSYHQVKFNGSIVFESIYRGEPREELDAAWSALDTSFATVITDEEFAAIPYQIESIKVPEEAGGGYLATIDVLHQIHCVNYLRKASVWNYDYYRNRSREFHDKETMQRHHFDHCADMLRQVLMCNADVTLTPYRWMRGLKGPQFDFSGVHMCRNFDSIRAWSDKRQLSAPAGWDWQPSPGDPMYEGIP